MGDFGHSNHLPIIVCGSDNLVKDVVAKRLSVVRVYKCVADSFTRTNFVETLKSISINRRTAHIYFYVFQIHSCLQCVIQIVLAYKQSFRKSKKRMGAYNIEFTIVMLALKNKDPA